MLEEFNSMKVNVLGDPSLNHEGINLKVSKLKDANFLGAKTNFKDVTLSFEIGNIFY